MKLFEKYELVKAFKSNPESLQNTAWTYKKVTIKHKTYVAFVTDILVLRNEKVIIHYKYKQDILFPFIYNKSLPVFLELFSYIGPENEVAQWLES
jgi:hypothetical protein